ncbi:MAG: LarC family nickel insertion protein [Geminicoccaceae bacterium]|nr:LarC family nickel insertion protein [Geminicoccaceae bacterium]
MALGARLDPLGGIAGDMFVAAMADAFPHEIDRLPEVARALDVPGAVSIEEIHDGVQGGRCLRLDLPHEHAHRSWSDIRALLGASALQPAVRERATAIFALLAEAEAAVHAVPVDAVHFHEVGALDSILDIALAAHMVEASGIGHWQVGPLPLGGGRVASRHGTIAVPAPATVRLLEGFEWVDDGIGGERVTPTGAAILRHLCGTAPVMGHLTHQGQGFGSRRMAGVSNLLRVMVFDDRPAKGEPSSERILEIAFEVDDQTAEDLALGLERLRGVPGVHDVLQFAAIGKKGRMVTAVRLLAEASVREPLIERCFLETTTLGLRIATVERRVLERRRSGDVKLAMRPGGVVTGKMEIDAVGDLSAHERASKRHERVAAVLEAEESHEGDA